MTPVTFDSHQFHLQTKFFQEETIAEAVQKAEQFASQEKTSTRRHVVSHTICKEAYDIFKNKVQKSFPSPVYNDLITLTLQSRETVFFVDLKERITTIITRSKSNKNL